MGGKMGILFSLCGAAAAIAWLRRKVKGASLLYKAHLYRPQPGSHRVSSL